MESWSELLKICAESCREEHIKKLSEALCGKSLEHCIKVRRRTRRRYDWIQKIIDNGVPDGRARLILYVISRYLINVLNMSVEEAQSEIEAFLENSCNKQGKCGGIYKSWIRSVLRGVSRGGWKPWSLEKLKSEDPQLYEIVTSVLEQEQAS